MFRIARERGTERAFFLLLVCGILAAALFSGCDGQEQPSGQLGGTGTPTAPKKTPAPGPGVQTPGKPPANAAVTQEQRATWVSAIETTKDLIGLYETVGNIPPSVSSDAQVTASVAKKRKELLTNAKTLKVSDSLNLVAFGWKRVGPERYRCSWLFEVKGAIQQNCYAYMYGYVNERHAQLLDEPLRAKRVQNWTLELMGCPPTYQWKAGDYVLATSRVIEAKDIPYKISFNLIYKDGKAEGPLQYGEFLQLGWYADPGE